MTLQGSRNLKEANWWSYKKDLVGEYIGQTCQDLGEKKEAYGESSL